MTKNRVEEGECGQRPDPRSGDGLHAVFACLDWVRVFLRAPEEVWGMMREYLAGIFCGIGWFLAGAVGLGCYLVRQRELFVWSDG